MINYGKKQMIEITEEEHDRLLERDAFLCALEAAGVDNWNDYSVAHDILKEWQDEEK